MTRRLWIQAAAILTLGLAASQAFAQQTGITVTYLGTQDSLAHAQPRVFNVTPVPPVITFNAAAVGISSGSAQQITAVFNVNGNPGTFTPTGVLHYGTSYSAGTVACTGPVASMTCSVTITFQPLYPGGRRDALFFMNGTTRLATVLLYGVGNAPFGLIQPGVITNPILNSTNYQYTSIVDENGTAYVLETEANAVESVTKAGVVTTLPITGLNSPRGLGIDGAGVLYFADQTSNGPTITYDTVQGIQGSIPFPTTPAPGYIQDLAVGDTGNIYETNSIGVYTIPLSGASTYTAFNPVLNPGPAIIATDDADNVFLAGTSTIYELPVAATQQTIINNIGAGDGLGVDAADTLYGSRYSVSSTDSVGELPATNYATNIAVLDPTASPLGNSVGPDGTVWVGNYTNLDKVDRSQGQVVFTNSTTGTQNVSIYNGGNQSLTVSNIAITGSAVFTVGTATTNNCTGGITILPGALCNVAVSYSTTHAGVFTGTLTFTDNSLNSAASTQTVAITAQFQGIYVTPSPTSLNFNTQLVGTTSASQPVTFTNNGDAYSAGISLPQNTGPFVVNLGTCATLSPLAVGASCTMNVSFAPTTTTAYVNTSISFGATWSGPTQVVTFTVNGTGIMPSAPVANFAPSSLAFGTQNINTTSPSQPLLLTNTGTSQLNLNSITITGTNLSNFSQTNTCGGGLAPNASCTINVTFTPTVVGPYSATVSVADNAAISPTTATLTGTGVSLQVPQLQFNPLQLNAIAGTGVGKVLDTGDGGPALQATFNTPEGVVQDATGNIYVSDQDDNYVRKIDTSGNITAFAGAPSSGSGGFSGDGGQATAATLSQPIGLAIDGAGNVYIADYGNARIRRVASNGVITTFAGNGNGFFNGGTAGTVPLPGPTGIAFDAAGNLYVVCTNQQIIAKITPAGLQSLFAGVLTNPGPGVNGYNGDNILAYNADLNFPQDVAADQAGNIYIADTSNARIRMVAASTGIITTVAGNGTTGNTGDNGAATSAQINANGIATDLAGELFITTGTSIRKVDVHGNISTYAGGGSNTVPGPSTSVALVGLGLPRIDHYGSLLITGFHPYDGVLSAGPNGILVFPNQTVGTTSAPLTVTFENTGDATLTLSQSTYTATGNFNVTGGTCTSVNTLAPSATCTLTVTFSPASAAALTGSIAVASNSGASPQSIALQGTGTPAAAVPVVTITPNPDAFLPSPVGQQENAPLPMSLTNTGTGPLTITGITITGANASSFSQTNLCPVSPATLAAGAACGITVVFNPTTGGALTANVSVASDASGSPALATLTGMGTVPQLTLNPNPLTFASQTVNTTSAPLGMTISNPGGAPLLINSATLGGTNSSDFTETQTCGTTLAAGANCTFMFTFNPLGTGTRTATLTFVDNASGSPQILTLTGTGTAAAAPQATLNPNPVNFPSTVVGASSQTMTMSLGNPGNATLNISGISITGSNASSFSQTNNCGSTLPLDSSCTITVTFTPSAAGALTANISVADNATGSPQTATITGTGAVVVTSGTFTVNSSTPSASVQPGSVAQYNLTVAPLGGTYTNLVTLSATGLPAGATASFAPPAVTPGSAGAPSVLSIQTSSLFARETRPNPHSPAPLLAVLAGVPLLGLAARQRFRKASRRWMLLAIAALAILPALALSGCGGGYFGPAPQTFTITVVGTSGSLQESTTVSLTVQ